MFVLDLRLSCEFARLRQQDLRREAEAARRARDLPRAGRGAPGGELRAGFAATLPLWLGVVPVGIAYALAAQAAGLSAAQTLGMSLLVYAGTAQLAATELLAERAGGLSIVLATLVINARNLALAASLAPHLARLCRRRRAGLAFTLSDESFVISMPRVVGRAGGAAFLLGSGASLYIGWQLGTGVGLLLGRVMPDPAVLGLDLVFPLSFSALLVSYLRSRPARAAAVVAGGLALGGDLLLPAGSSILVAAAAGSLAGALLEARR